AILRVEFYVAFAGVDHRLDREHHTLAQFEAGTLDAVVQHLRFLVKNLADAVAAVFAHHRVVIRFGVLLDDVADIAETRARFDHGNRFIQTFLRDQAQALGVAERLADMEHRAGIAVPAILDDGDVDIDDVAVLEGFLVRRNAVADNFVDRGANRLGEAVVIQRRRNHLLHVDHVVVADAIEFAGGDPGYNVGFYHLQHFGGETAGHAQFVDFLGGFYGYGHERQLPLIKRL